MRLWLNLDSGGLECQGLVGSTRACKWVNSLKKGDSEGPQKDDCHSCKELLTLPDDFYHGLVLTVYDPVAILQFRLVDMLSRTLKIIRHYDKPRPGS